MRISKDEYYLGIAEVVSKRSTCLRRQYGAVIVKNDRVVATGYNGTARKILSCEDLGSCYRAEHDIPHGERYEKCRSVHAEANAIINANREDLDGATLYLVGFENGVRLSHARPCEMCERMITNAGIAVVKA